MQALQTQGLLLNRRHPDAPGCFFAVPVMERGGEVVRDVAWRGSKGLGQPAWIGTRSWANLRGGRAIVTSVGNYVETPASGTPWAGQFSAVATILPISTPGAAGIIRCGGFVLTPQANVLRLFTDAGGIVATGTVAITNNVEYSIGVRWRGSDNLVSFYVNGARENQAGAAIGTASVPTGLGRFPAGVSFDGRIRDVRIWNRYMPDETFERYYTNPNAFYTRGGVAALKAAGGAAAGRFFPFLHPSFQS